MRHPICSVCNVGAEVSPRCIQVVVKLYVLALLCLCTGAQAENKGPSYVKKVLPYVYEAVTATLGDQADDFFREWTKQEVQFFAEKLDSLIVRLQQGKLTKAQQEELLKAYHKMILGTLGETYGLSLLRAKYRDDPQILIMDEIQYAIDNNEVLEDNNRPDGLAYSIEGNRLIVHEIMESKMSDGIDRAQVAGWIARWRANGIRVGQKHFRPDKIFFEHSGVRRPLKGIRQKRVLEIMLGVTRGRLSQLTGDARSIDMSAKGARQISARIVSLSASMPSRERFVRSSDFVNRLEQEIVRRVMDRFDKGQVFFPSATEDSGEEGRFGRLIRHHFGSLAELYDALPKKYQRMADEAGFDPKNPASSSKRMRGRTDFTKEVVRQKIMAQFDRGEIFFPSNGADGEEGKLARAISTHYGGVGNLYDALPKKYTRMADEAGFDRNNPVGSSRLMRYLMSPEGSQRRARERTGFSKKIVLQIMKDRFDSGQVFFPSLRDEGEEGRLALGIKSHFGKIANFYDALPKKYRRMADRAGFDRKNPQGSVRLMRGKAGFSREIVLQKIMDRFDRGQVYFPTAADPEEEGKLGVAIFSHFGDLGHLYDALPKKYRRMADEAGFDRNNPNSSSKRMRGVASFSKTIVLQKIMKRFDDGQVFFPSQNDDGEDGRLGSAIRTHFGNLAEFYDALPKRYRRMADKAGFDRNNPYGSARFMRGETTFNKEIVLQMIMDRFDRGLIFFPSQKDPNEEGKLGIAIRYHFGGLVGLYDALPPKYRRMADNAGFSRDNPRWSSQRMRQKAIEAESNDRCSKALKGVARNAA